MDTSAVIKYFNCVFPMDIIYFIDEVINDAAIISFITEIELQVWDPTEKDDIIVFRQFVKRSTVIGISENIIEKTIEIRKNYRLKIPDAIIAATAITNGYTLIADNDKDFLKVKGLNYLNPKNIR